MKKTIEFIRYLLANRHNYKALTKSAGVKLMIYVFLTVVGFVFVFPFLYMVITSIKSPKDLYDITVNWIPSEVFYNNFIQAFKKLNYLPHFAVSFFLTAFGVGAHIIFDSYIAYGLARYNFPGKTLVVFLIILTLIVPIQVIILPTYLQFAYVGLTDSYFPILLPLLFGFGLRSGLFILIFRQYFMLLPKSIEEAAKIDGCNYFHVFWKIVLPSARTAILVCFVLAMVWHYNDYYTPAIFLNSIEKWPVPSMLPRIYEEHLAHSLGKTKDLAAVSQNVIRDPKLLVTEGVVMAATLLVIAPVVTVYAFIQKKFMEGVERSGIVE